jgi:hypothetical protein
MKNIRTVAIRGNGGKVISESRVHIFGVVHIVTGVTYERFGSIPSSRDIDES